MSERFHYIHVLLPKAHFLYGDLRIQSFTAADMKHIDAEKNVEKIYDTSIP